MNFIGTPGMTYQTGLGNLVADSNGLINNVTNAGQILALFEANCSPINVNPLANFRNIIDGGDFTVNPWQRNIPGLASAGVISAAVTSTVTYFADRFFAVGGASSSILMANVADTTLTGFSQSLKLSRSSGNTDVTAIKLGQVIETLDSVKAQGQLVTFSFWARTGANYSGGALSVAVISGSGSNQSATSMVAGTWTGQASVVSTTQVLNSAMTRYSFSGTVPVSTTQLGVQVSFTPTGTAGVDDSITFQGFQLEIGTLTPFEHRDVQVELEICQRYAWVIAEPASGVLVGVGSTLGANSQIFYMAAPVQFYKAPTVTVSVGSFQIAAGFAYAGQAGLAAGSTHTVNAISVTAAVTAAGGSGALLAGGGGSGRIIASADF
jgi:hypothetical protein